MSSHVGLNEARSLVILTHGVVKLIYKRKKWQSKLTIKKWEKNNEK
jgi:hypothetical protein